MKKFDWSTFWSFFAALGSMIAAIFAAISSQSSDRIALQSQVSEQMSRYLSAYTTLSSELDDPFSLAGFLSLTRDKDKTRVQIVAGLQIVLVDLMFDAGDPRRTEWLRHISIPGPTACSDVLVYARRPETRKFLQQEMANLKTKTDCKSSTE